MREYLFRGKEFGTGIWRQGDLSYNRFGEPSIYSNGFGQLVHPETVGEWTGLTDEAGQKIFEGDILRYAKSDGSLSEFATEVRFGTYNCSCCRGVYGWYLSGGGGDIRDFCGYEDAGPYVVVGNIHDNPELLEDLERPTANSVRASQIILAAEEQFKAMIEETRMQITKEDGP